MCLPKPPKAPNVQAIPDRRASILPDGGDPSVRINRRNKRGMMPSSMIFTNQGTLGAPSVSGPQGN